MKNWKKNPLIGFLVMLIFTIIFITCDKNNDPFLCNCEIKEHLGINETCCGGDDCNCSEQIVALNGTEIIIKKQAGITVTQMNTGVTFFVNYFDTGISGPDREKIKAGITIICIVPGNEAHKVGTIWYIGFNADKEYCDDSLVFGWN